MTWKRAALYGAGSVLALGALGYIVLRLLMQGRITSWWRLPWHNAQVGGVKNSRHQIGLAWDVSPGTERDGKILSTIAAIIPTAKLVDERKTKNHWHFQIV